MATKKGGEKVCPALDLVTGGHGQKLAGRADKGDRHLSTLYNGLFPPVSVGGDTKPTEVLRGLTICGIVGLYQNGKRGGSMSKLLGFLTVDNKGRTTFPREMRHELGLGEGTHLRVERSDLGTVELIPSVSVPVDQLWFHSDEIKARVARAEEDFRTGRSTRTEGLDETQRFLDSLKSGAPSDAE